MPVRYLAGVDSGGAVAKTQIHNSLRRLHFFICAGTVSVIICALNLFLQISQNSTAVAGKNETPTPWYIYIPVLVAESTPTVATPTPPVSPDGRPSWGAPIAISPANEQVWVVNPDAGSVTVVDAIQLAKTDEIQLGQEPWSLAISPAGDEVYVLDRTTGILIILNAYTHQVIANLSIGSEPGQIALSPTGSRAYITLTSDDEVAIVDLKNIQLAGRISVQPRPYAIAITDDGDEDDDDEIVYVTHLLALSLTGGLEATDDGRAGQVTIIDTGKNTIIDQIRLLPNINGFPNLLAGVALTQDTAWIPQVRAAPNLPNDLTTTVFAAVTGLHLGKMTEVTQTHLLLNDQDVFGSPVNNPVAAIPSPDGKMLYVVLAGSDLVEVIDVTDPSQPRLLKFLSAGRNPRGLAISQDGKYGYVMSFLSRAITVLDLEQLEMRAEIPVTSETLEPDVFRGKILFNNATSPKMSQGSWLSCASCHPDGGTDSVTWMFPDGPRQTPPIWNATETLPWHWSAALDEAQDVEDTIQHIQHGLGLASGIDPPLLGEPNANRSESLDALATFMAHGIRVPNAPSLMSDTSAGRALFLSAGCNTCHGGPSWTDSTLSGEAGTLDPDSNGMIDAGLHDVGTYNPLDLRGEHGFDSPALLGVGLTAPYFHDGSMPDLIALLASGHPDPHGAGNGLNNSEIEALSLFLQSIGVDTPPFDKP